MLIDPDVLIWLTRGHPGAAERLDAILATLLTANVKHFSTVDGMHIEVLTPRNR